MSSRTGNILRAGLLILMLIMPGFVASATPAYAAGNCTTADNSQVPGNTQVACSGANVTSSTCTQVDNGFKTCDVRNFGNGLEFLAIAVAIGGIFMSAILWALGSKGENPGQELTGKRGMIVCLMAAMLIGAYPTLSSFFETQAGNPDVDKTGVTKAGPTVIQVPAGTPGGSTSTAK